MTCTMESWIGSPRTGKAPIEKLVKFELRFANWLTVLYQHNF